MNDLIIPNALRDSCPSLWQGLEKVKKVFEEINSFEDIERVFLLGQGLSRNTYRSYLAAVKQLYVFTGGLNPLQITAAHIEAFYDDLLKRRVDQDTACLRIRGLKNFFKGIRRVLPFYTSPFETMPKALLEKLQASKKGNRTKKAMSPGEVRDLLDWLRRDRSLIGRENYAIVFMLVTSGLRASEFCQLRWGDIEEYEGMYTAKFIGKGRREAEQELYAPAVEACRAYFRAHFRRKPKPSDALFYSNPNNGREPIPLCYATLWRRVTNVGAAARSAGIVKRDYEFSPHLFRRTYATVLYREGMRLKALAAKTRHSSINILTEHYIHDEDPATPYLNKVFAMAG